MNFIFFVGCIKISKITIKEATVILIYRSDDSPLPRCKELFESEKLNGNTILKRKERKKIFINLKNVVYLSIYTTPYCFPHCLSFLYKKENHKPTPSFHNSAF